MIDALDCYSDPVRVVETALDRGMDYVALTDHNSIGGWQEVLSRRPDLGRHVIPGVELDCVFPEWGLKIHVNVLGITEEQHLTLLCLRSDIHRLLNYAESDNLVVVFNHPLRTVWRQPRLAEFLEYALPLFKRYEVLNGSSPCQGNRAASALAAILHRSGSRVGGSDAHTLRRVAQAYTLAVGDTQEEFLESVRRGPSFIGGAESGVVGVIADIYRVVGSYYASLWGPMFRGDPARRLRNQLWALILLPGSLIMPALLGGMNHAQHASLGWWLQRYARSGRPAVGSAPELRKNPE
ncbi:MAG: hypothetical protein O7A63_08300 [Acidobacteria bacterium]|nr:hypothetical protein [Acidobacteriota bacterium]